MALILGIDPGSRVTGYGLITSTGTSANDKLQSSLEDDVDASASPGNVYIDSGCIRTSSQGSRPERLAEIFSGVSEIIERYGPTEVAIEQVFMSKGADSALKLGEARGVAIVAAVEKGLPVFEYAARRVKQAVVGKGGATKAQVQHMVTALLQLPGKPASDAADALAIALCHIHTRQGLVRMAGAGTYRHGRLRWQAGR